MWTCRFRTRLLAVLGIVCLGAGACSSTEVAILMTPAAIESTTTTTTTTAPKPITTHSQAPPWTGLARVVDTQDHTVFATTGNLSLVHPARNVERIGFHESSHDGAQQMAVLDSTIAWVVMDTRDRGNASRTAADIVVDPADPIMAPVTGTVIRSGGYTLYCQYSDNFLVIEPDDQPGWEVKMFHVLDLTVATGDSVVAGQTQVAIGARLLPFDSQVDRFTAAPAWGHVHIEVVDPTIADRRSAGGC